jgi:hypothetical protein
VKQTEKQAMSHHKDAKRVRAGLREAFKILRHWGYFAKANFLCCQSCGFRAIADAGARKAVFYHGQDNDHLNESGICHLAWEGNGHEVKLACEAVGLKVEWNGTDAKRTRVSAHPLN